MANPVQCIKLIEKDLAQGRPTSLSAFSCINEMDEAEFATCWPVFSIVFRDPSVEDSHLDSRRELRISLCRLIPVFFHLPTGNPAWSSFLMAEAWRAMLALPGLNANEPFIALGQTLLEYDCPASPAICNFIMDFVKGVVIHARHKSAELDANVMFSGIENKLSASVGFMLHNLFDEYDLSTRQCRAILEATSGTSEWKSIVVGLIDRLREDRDFDEYLTTANFADDEKRYLSEVE